MAKSHSITPFPDDTDRDAFGHWLSGFADGEGCFQLALCGARTKISRIPIAIFSIMLRQDDEPILEQIRSFWGVGGIFRRPARGTIQPSSRYHVQKASELTRVILPHFDRYPLRAKKRHDFPIWREGVELISRVLERPVRAGNGKRRAHRWGDRDRDGFAALIMALQRQRAFPSTEPEAMPALPPPEWSQASFL